MLGVSTLAQTEGMVVSPGLLVQDLLHVVVYVPAGTGDDSGAGLLAELSSQFLGFEQQGQQSAALAFIIDGTEANTGQVLQLGLQQVLLEM